jgi:hypothetical protein
VRDQLLDFRLIHCHKSVARWDLSLSGNAFSRSVLESECVPVEPLKLPLDGKSEVPYRPQRLAAGLCL